MPKLDRNRLFETFSEDFDSPLQWWSDERQLPPGKVWRTGFEHSRWPGVDLIASRFLGAERQVYIDPAYRNMLINPFEVRDRRLIITARKFTPGLSKELKGQTHSSGTISSAQAFQQIYGYFECRAKLPKEPGFFPAFWLYSFSGHTEIDVMECLTGNPRVLYNGAIQIGVNGERHEWNQVARAEANPGQDLAADFHTFGVLWTAAGVTFFLDDEEQWGFEHTPSGVPNDPGFHEPMYMIVNLAVGGKWNDTKGYEPADTGQMQIEHVRAYRYA